MSILQELEMKNPVIVGDLKELKMDVMFHLMKRIMKQNQNVLITSDIRNESIIESPGIILRQNLPDDFFEKPINLHKPWIVFGTQIEKYSQINQPLYFLDNGTLYEQFQIKSLKMKVRRF